MADNNASGQGTRQSGASEIPSAPSDCSGSKGGPTSAKDKKRPRKSKTSDEERSPNSSNDVFSVGKSLSSSPPASGTSPSSTRSSKRTHFTPQQIYKLEQFFLKSQFPTAKERENLAKELQLSTKHIQVWFQNHRAKYKRKEKKKAKAEMSVVKLNPPQSWPAQLPFDSSIASVSLGGEAKDSKESCGKKEKASVSRIHGSTSPSHSVSIATPSDVSGSTSIQSTASSYSPDKQLLTAYPLSPSSPLHTPHAPMRKRSSSVTPCSPLSCTFSPTSAYSPGKDSLYSRQSTSTATVVGPSHIHATGAAGSDPDYTGHHLYSSSASRVSGGGPLGGSPCLDSDSFQTRSDFSPPIFAESPVHLQNLLNDPEIGSILREHLPLPKKISVTETNFGSYQTHSSSTTSSSSLYFNTPLSQVTGFGVPVTASTHHHFFPPNYPVGISPTLAVSQRPMAQITPFLSSPIDTGGIVHPTQPQPSSHFPPLVHSTRPTQNIYRQPMGIPLPHGIAPGSYNITSPGLHSSSHIHPFAQSYTQQDPQGGTLRSYSNRPPLSVLESQFFKSKPSTPVQQQGTQPPLPSAHDSASPQVLPKPSYHADTPPSVPPLTPVSPDSSILFDQSPNQ